MIDYSSFYNSIEDTPLAPLGGLRDAVAAGLDPRRFGELPAWLEALADLPDAAPSTIGLETSVSIGVPADLDGRQAQLENALKRLSPWRKGPFELFGVHIDTEWRSDWKWARVQPHLRALTGRQVLDVGCGNGYYALRMLGAGAGRVVGVDPSPRFVVQFEMLRRYLGEIPVTILPLPLEALPDNLQAFDTTFSMGVLYHRRSPMDHLRELKATLKPGGELVLETLVVDGPLGHTLVPEGRYAMMGNVWFIPSVPTLESWLRKAGFVEVHTVDVSTTGLDEQRRTEWMQSHSLKEFLDPADTSKTAEGHPAPKRAVMLAQKPG